MSMGWEYERELRPPTGIMFIPRFICEYGGSQLNDIDRGKQRPRRKACPNATMSTTNYTRADPQANPGLRCERPATNRLSYGTAFNILFGSWTTFYSHLRSTFNLLSKQSHDGTKFYWRETTLLAGPSLCLVTGIVGLNPARGMDVCLCVYMLCCPV
jgi:hypothetical protein